MSKAPSAASARAASTLTAIRHRLQEIAAAALTAAEAVEVCCCDFIEPEAELGRLLGRLDGVAERLADVCELLAAAVDPQPAPGTWPCR